LETYSRSHLRVAFPGLLREVVIRLLQALLVTAYFVNLVDFREFLIANVVIYVFTLLALIGHLIYSGHFQLTVDFSFFQFQKLKALLQFSTLSFIGTSSIIIIGKVDSLMVAGLLGLASNAIYTTAFYMATVIEIPKRAILQTTMPLIAEAFEKNNLDEIKKIYQRVSINQLIIGSLLLIGVWVNLHNIYALVPKGEVFQTGAVVVLLVGIAKLIDMVFGPSSEIIVLSRYYAFNIAVVLVLAVTVIGLNLLLIPRYGLAGAAGGSVAAMFLFNFTKYIFIYFTFGLQPFSRHTVLVLLIAGLTIGLNYALPVAANTILDIVYRSGLITLVFAALIYFSKSSTELNELALRTWKRIFGS
jgi:O-antigen/teichoic acid export membrane protein